MLDRIELLLGKENIERIKKSKIVVIGLGGVGGFVLESLVRSGICNISIVDFDNIDKSNLNRQIIALNNNIGNSKAGEWEKRLKLINEEININTYNMFLDSLNIDEIITKDVDCVIDACDSIKSKEEIINKCLKENIKFITCLGTGKRMDPSFLTICDIRNTSYDPLAKKLRKYIKDNNIKEKITCCYSKEIPKKIESNEIASSIFVPASAGLLISSYVIRDICK